MSEIPREMKPRIRRVGGKWWACSRATDRPHREGGLIGPVTSTPVKAFEMWRNGCEMGFWWSPHPWPKCVTTMGGGYALG